MKALGKLLKRVHRDEKGAVSIETILIIAAIALPILIFILKFGWPRIREFFEEGMEDLEGAADEAASGTDNTTP
jgi:Flp pilus assembly pilin Flp